MDWRGGCAVKSQAHQNIKNIVGFFFWALSSMHACNTNTWFCQAFFFNFLDFIIAHFDISR